MNINQTTLAQDTVDVPRGLRERQRRMREEAILEAAFALIVEKGYEAMTMDDLADRVGISKPTLYNHFESKEAIAVRALVTLNERAVESIHAIDPTLAPLDRLRGVVEWMLRNRFSPTAAAFLRARPALMPAKSHPDYIRAAERRIQAVATIIDDAQAAGQVAPSLSSRLLAQMLFSLACSPDYDLLLANGAASTVDIGQAVMTLVFNGIRPHTP